MTWRTVRVTATNVRRTRRGAQTRETETDS